jgi:hypothetical protein
MTIGALHWLGLSAARAGDRRLARAAAIPRWVARNQINLAQLDISDGEVPQARKRLEESREMLARTQKREAEAAYYEARDLFARMGLLHELADDDRMFGII